jgi:hypothetical protein
MKRPRKYTEMSSFRRALGVGFSRESNAIETAQINDSPSIDQSPHTHHLPEANDNKS